jgi:hypothetical protein
MVELLVVSVIMAIVAMIVMQGSSPMAASTLRLRDRSYSSNELRLLSESILKDAGGSWRMRAVGGDMRLDRYDDVLVGLGLYSGGPDAGLVYSLVGTDLHRADNEAGTDVIVARMIQGFDVRRVNGVGIVSTITSGVDDAERSIDLIWSY